MRKRLLETKLLVMIMVSVSILFTGCGRKDTEDLLPAETLAEQGTDLLDAEGIEETYMSPEELEEIESMKTNPFEDETDEITEAEMASVEAELARQKEEDAKAAEKAAQKDTKKETKAESKAEEKKDTKTTAKADTRVDTKKDAASAKSETTAPAKQETTSSNTSSANNSTSGSTASTPASTPAASTTPVESSQPSTPAPAPSAPDPATCSHEYVYIGPGLDAPSCEYMGTSFYKCTKCGAGKDQTDVPALGHDYSIVEEIVVGQCNSSSTVKYTCSRCGLSYYQEENLHADDHNWITVTGTKVNWDTLEEETCTQTYCTRCGKTQ